MARPKTGDSRDRRQRGARLRTYLFGLIAVLGIAPSVAAQDLLSDVLRRFHPTADLRLRYAADIDRINGDLSRQRGRLRLRVGTTIDVTDDVVAGLRIRTGNRHNPRNPYADFGSDFSSFEISLARAFVVWAPGFAPGLQLSGGKMSRGFKTTPIYGQLVWDSDVNPEGAEIRYQQALGDMTLGVVGGSYVLHQNLTGSESAYLLSAQGWISGSPTEDFEYGLAVGFNGYGNLVAGKAGTSTPEVPDPNPGSPKILHPLGFFTWSGEHTALTLSAEYMRNLDVSEQNQGWSIGSMFAFRLWGREINAYYQFQRIDAKAVYPKETQDDFAMASNFNGQLFGASWQISKRIELNSWALFTQSRAPGAPHRYEKRFRVDLNFAL